MAIYRVHLPAAPADEMAVADRARFVREGFCWPAFLFGPLWMLARALWRPLAVWCLGAIVIGFAARSGWLRESGVLWLYGLSALFLGLEGRNLVAAGIEHSGLGFVDIVEGADQTEAEEAFFHRLATASPQAALGSPRIVAAPNHVIGMFPEAGG